MIFITAYPERFLTGERPEPAFLIAKPFQPAMVSAIASQALFFERNAKQPQETAGALSALATSAARAVRPRARRPPTATASVTSGRCSTSCVELAQRVVAELQRFVAELRGLAADGAGARRETGRRCR